MKKILLAIAFIAAFAPASLAEGTKAAAQNELGGKPVRSTNGNCVRTKWDDSNDVCAPAEEPAPEPVVEAPAPEPATQLTEEQRTVYFDFNKSDLNAESFTKLDTLIDAVVASKGVQKVTVVGFADDIGSADYNQALSEKRSGVVESYIDTKVTIPTEAKVISAQGENNPTTSCPTTMKRAERIKCLAADRRVEVQFTYAK
jgi:OmpA-OmpF porin, OOP family